MSTYITYILFIIIFNTLKCSDIFHFLERKREIKSLGQEYGSENDSLEFKSNSRNSDGIC